MHDCINNTGGNLSHLEQMVNNFLPYSKQQLGFDKPVKIVFQSDPSNADVLLGKTAHYNPEQYEVYLYTDKRHPKDIMRSLSHELVHHAQNCRGDFGSCDDTSPGYAQRDPHLRKMEREAYTKGNLIFRDFEDLIKRGKITIDINFKDSGEPQMSLKEWKDNELNMLLMKKWGLLSEGTAKEREDEEGNRPSMAKDLDLTEWAPGHEPAGSTHDFLGNPLSSAPKGTKAKSTRWYAGDSKPGEGDSGAATYAHDDPESEEYHTDPALEKRREYQRWRISQGLAEAEDLEEEGHPGKSCEEAHPGKSCEEAHPGEKHPVEEDQAAAAAKKREDGAVALMALGGAGQAAKRQEDMPYRHDEEGEDPALARAYGVGAPEGMSDEEAAMAGHTIGRGGGPGLPVPPKGWGDPPAPGKRIRNPRDLQRTTTKVPAVNVREGRSQKISVREAQEITRRIIERIKKEGK